VEIAEGFSNKEIADHLGVGVRTVETHREHVMRKLNIHSVAGLTKFAVARRLVPLEGVTCDRGQVTGIASLVARHY
jgi:DNA-binding NarL/FixJ family response regulator